MQIKIIILICLFLFSIFTQCKKDDSPAIVLPKISRIERAGVLIRDFKFSSDGRLIVEKLYIQGKLSGKSDYFYQNNLISYVLYTSYKWSTDGSINTSYKYKFTYNSSNFLSEVANYKLTNLPDTLETYFSGTKFEYADKRLKKQRWIISDGRSMMYDEYEYNADGNVSSIKNYSIAQPGTADILNNETKYVYDKQINPFNQFPYSGSGFLLSQINQNNLIETTTYFYENGVIYGQNATLSFACQYNSFGLPTIVGTENYFYE